MCENIPWFRENAYMKRSVNELMQSGKIVIFMQALFNLTGKELEMRPYFSK